MSTSSDPRLPDWLYPDEHAGRCYDQIGATSVATGAAAGPLLAAVVEAVEALLDGRWPLALGDVVPDPAVAGITGAATAAAMATLFLARHWHAHRQLAHARAETRHLLEVTLRRAASGEIDRQTCAELLTTAGFGDLAERLLAVDDRRPFAEPEKVLVGAGRLALPGPAGSANGPEVA